MISGKRVRQLPDYSFLWDMDDYSQDKLKSIDVPRGFMSNTAELDQSMLDKVGTCNGQIGWLGGNGRPDVAAGGKPA